MSQSIFNFKHFSLNQTNAPFKLCQDSCILGAVVASENPQKILDIGTGTGILALMQAQKFPRARIDAVEINKEAAKVASINFVNSPWAGRFSLFDTGLQEFMKKEAPPADYDLVICNPPFYQDQLKGKGFGRNQATHQISLDFSSLIEAVDVLLKPDGLFYCLISAFKVGNFLEQLKNSHLFVQKSISIAHDPTKPVQRLIYRIGRVPSQLRSEQLNIKDEGGNFSPAMKFLLKDFYLAF